MKPALPALGLPILLFVASGATCHQFQYGKDPMAPVVFASPPSLDQVIYTVNANTDRVRQLHSDSAWLSVAGMPALRTNLSLERPNRLRIRSKLIAAELDLGSNDEIFWFWAKSAPEPVVYYASHREYATSPARSLFPVDPHWLVEAIGLIRLEPGGGHAGPFVRPDGKLEVRTRIPTPTGELTRILVIDGRYGWILEQQLLDVTGQQLAVSRTTGHRFDPVAQTSLPHRIEIEMPESRLALRIDVTEYLVNQLYEDPNQLWSMPQIAGYTPVNIAAPQALPASMPLGQPGGIPSPLYRESRASLQPPYRGHSDLR